MFRHPPADVKQFAEPLSPMPDVAADPRLGGALAWVGMEGISTPVNIAIPGSAPQPVIATVDAFVNLIRGDQRGIHMSRMYRLIDEHLSDAPLDAKVLERLLHAFLVSQDGLADHARVCLRFDQPLRRKALRSHHYGWRIYPITIEATLSKSGFDVSVATDITYSSTCPASAALTRQVIQAQFAAQFPSPAPIPRDAALDWLGHEQGIPATPHAQRSVAHVWIRLRQGRPWDTTALIDRIEASLGTPVQTVVKREDEQAFALANGRNLMFCEDAARRIQRTLNLDDDIADFHIRVVHHESLHPHNAVAHARKEPSPLAT